MLTPKDKRAHPPFLSAPFWPRFEAGQASGRGQRAPFQSRRAPRELAGKTVALDDPVQASPGDLEDAGRLPLVPAGLPENLLNMGGLGAKIRDAGDISEADYAAFANIGIDREFVADYVGMVKDRAEAHVTGVKDALGGEDGWTNMKTWAQENLSQEDRDGYDSMLNSPQWHVAVDALRSRMGQPPLEAQGKIVNADNQASPTEASSQGYADQAAMNLAIQDPKYKLNTTEGVEFRSEVMRRAANSSWDTQSKRFHNAGL